MPRGRRRRPRASARCSRGPAVGRDAAPGDAGPGLRRAPRRGRAGCPRRSPSARPGADVRTGATVRELRAHRADGWRLVDRPGAADPERIDADAVVSPCRPRRPPGCSAGVAPAAAARAGRIDYASDGDRHARLAVDARSRGCRRQRLPGAAGRGPAGQGRDVLARSSGPHLRRRRPGAVVRCSVGRHGEEPVLQRDDAELVALALADLADADRRRWAARRRPGDPLGRRPAAVRRRATSTGWPGSGRPWPRSPGWRCAARPTTGSGIPACIASGARGRGPGAATTCAGRGE